MESLGGLGRQEHAVCRRSIERQPRGFGALLANFLGVSPLGGIRLCAGAWAGWTRTPQGIRPARRILRRARIQSTSPRGGLSIGLCREL